LTWAIKHVGLRPVTQLDFEVAWINMKDNLMMMKIDKGGLSHLQKGDHFAYNYCTCQNSMVSRNGSMTKG
jgi:hypothetical protein